MALPRLPPAQNDFTISIIINKELLPYFQEWFQENKISGESPEEYALRILKAKVKKEYIEKYLPQLTRERQIAMKDDITDFESETEITL